MPVEIDIARVARLARIGLGPEELEHYGAQLADILEHASRVQAVAAEGVEPTTHPLGLVNAVRSDDPGATLDRDEVLAAAPDHDGVFFRVPPFLDE